MAQQANNGSPISKGNVTGGNALPTAKKFPQPKAKGSVGSGSVNLHPESHAAVSALNLPNPAKHNASRPKGL